jgi:hypothetical protein
VYDVFHSRLNNPSPVGLVRRGPLAEFHTVGKDGRRIDHLHS